MADQEEENNEASAEGVDLPATADDGEAEEAEAPAEEADSGQPRFLTCHLCGQQQMLRSFYPHVEKCKKLWVAEENAKPRERGQKPRKLPPDPKLPGNAEISDLMSDAQLALLNDIALKVPRLVHDLSTCLKPVQTTQHGIILTPPTHLSTTQSRGFARAPPDMEIQVFGIVQILPAHVSSTALSGTSPVFRMRARRSPARTYAQFHVRAAH